MGANPAWSEVARMGIGPGKEESRMSEPRIRSPYTPQSEAVIKSALRKGRKARPRDRREALKRFFRSGEHLGAQLGLDTVRGIVEVHFIDYGGAHEWEMDPGTVVVFVWATEGMDREHLLEAVKIHRMPGILVQTLVRRAGLMRRLRSRVNVRLSLMGRWIGDRLSRWRVRR